MTLSVRYGARSDVGLLRTLNEDSMYAGPRLLAIADGMGGHAAGEVASRIAIESVAPLDEDQPGDDLLDSLRQAVDSASAYLRDMVSADNALEGMGTTLTALLFAGHRLGLLHIGDSRAYLLRENELTQITHDHTLVQGLIDEGRLSPEEATTHPQRSWITRALDGRSSIDPDVSVREVRPGDRYLICSDGLSGPVSEETLAETLRSGSPQDACDRLVDLALRAGGPDNITAIVADIVEDAPLDAESPIVGGAAASHPEEESRKGTSPAERAATIWRRPHRRPRAADAEQKPQSPRTARRLVIVLSAVLVLVAAGTLGTWLYVRTQYYVGAAKSQPQTVALYRGVSGQLLGIDLSSVSNDTNLPLNALPDYEQLKVKSGIDAKSRTDATRIIAGLRADACAQAVATARPVPAPSKSTKSSAAVSPAPTPSFCASPS